MRIRPEIAALIRDGHSNRYIAAEVGASKVTVRRVRAHLGYPPIVSRSVLTIGQVWGTYARPVGVGHIEWAGPTSHNGVPVFTHRGTRYQARAVAFRRRYGRDPVGYVKATCDHPGCVSPDHVADQPMRQQLTTTYTAIFGGTR